MRRSELEGLGIRLPVLPAIALGALPGGPGWSARLARLGLDVAASGADEDTRETLEGARAGAPHLPLKARASDPAVLAWEGPLIVETAAPSGPGRYRLGPGEALVPAVAGGDARVEEVMEVARRALDAARAGTPSALWVAATPGLDRLPPDLAEAKLAALADGARQARLYLAKEQFDT